MPERPPLLPPEQRCRPSEHDWVDLAEYDGIARTYMALICRRCGETAID